MSRHFQTLALPAIAVAMLLSFGIAEAAGRAPVQPTLAGTSAAQLEDNDTLRRRFAEKAKTGTAVTKSARRLR